MAINNSLNSRMRLLLKDFYHLIIEQHGHPNCCNSSNAHGLPGIMTGLSLFETRKEDREKIFQPYSLFSPGRPDRSISSLLTVVCHSADNKSHSLEA
jgi:hypothetical protein